MTPVRTSSTGIVGGACQCRRSEEHQSRSLGRRVEMLAGRIEGDRRAEPRAIGEEPGSTADAERGTSPMRPAHDGDPIGIHERQGREIRQGGREWPSSFRTIQIGDERQSRLRISGRELDPRRTPAQDDPEDDDRRWRRQASVTTHRKHY